MSLPTDFVASATALECYECCPRRFRHRYLEHSPAGGPDPKSAQRMQRGDLFHRLVVWDDLGLDTSLILESADDPDLVQQWTAYQSFRQSLPANGELLHDQTLVARCGTHPVQAKLDALYLGDGGTVTIYDWKTGDRLGHERLRQSPQSKVYPWVVWEVMRRRPGVALTDPGQVELVYWFSTAPGRPLRIPCTLELLEESSQWLTSLLHTIAADDEFPMTPDRSICGTCEYLAHCGVEYVQGDPFDLDEDYYQTPDPEDEALFDVALWVD